MKIWMFVFCLCLSGCVTTSKAVIHANKIVNLEQDPMKGDMQVGVRLEFFRDHTK
jgi:starvation-inducible outer membrane lipoprotein